MSLAAAVVLIANTAYACPTIKGTWTSSRDLTMAFADKHAKLEARQAQFLDQVTGRLTLQFDGTQVKYTDPDLDVKVEGKHYRLAGARETAGYQVLFCSAHTLVVRANAPMTRKQEATIYNFVDDDTMWVYQDSADSGLRDLNIREYFVRVRQPSH